MSLLLHAITAGRLADPPPGPRGADLEFVDLGALGLWASAEPASASRDDVFEHHRVVERLCEARPCLPIRFGTRADDVEAARRLLAPREAELVQQLERVGLRRELAVTLLWTDAAARPGRGHVTAGESGRSFLERKQRDQEAQAARRRTAEALARRLEEGLASEQADVRHAYCPSAEVALSTAVLARPGEELHLKEKAVKVAAALDGVRAVVSGPWPPYTFAG